MATADASQLTVENVVASADIGQELDLDTLCGDLPGAEYNAERFPGLIFRVNDPKAAALIFRSGKLVCTGAKGVNEVEQAIDTVFEAIEDLSIPTNSPEPAIQNIVSGADIGTGLNLNALAIGLGLEHVEYEPEQFPGLVYRPENADVVILLFGSGKTVITGARSLAHANEGLEIVKSDLDELGLLDD